MGFKCENDADKIDFAVFTKNTLSNGLFLYFFLKHIGCQAALVTFVSKTDKIQIDHKKVPFTDALFRSKYVQKPIFVFLL